MGNASTTMKEALPTVVSTFEVQEIFHEGQLMLLEEDEIFRRQLSQIAYARLPPHQQVQCFVAIFKIEVFCSLIYFSHLPQTYGWNFEGCGFTDLAYMARLTTHDLKYIGIVEPSLMDRILTAGMTLNSDPTVQQINRTRPRPQIQNQGDTGLSIFSVSFIFLNFFSLSVCFVFP